MADETLPGAGQSERRRPAPTIDLKATEVLREPAAASPDAAAAADQDTARDSAPTPPRSAAHAALAALAAAVSWPVIEAGVAGALLTLGVVWIVLAVTDRGSDLAAADARIAQLEQQVAGAASANSASSGDVAARLQKLEAELAAAHTRASQDPLADRVAALEGELKSLAGAADALRQRGDSAAAANAAALRELNDKLARSGAVEAQTSEASSEAASHNAAQITALSDRLDALEGGARKLEEGVKDALARRDAQLADDRALRTAVVAAGLAATVESGAPFAAELAAAQKQAADPTALAPIAPFAATGIGEAPALARELASLEPALRQAAAAPPADAGFLAKLSANAQRLVRISPLDEAPGDDLPTVITRAEVKAQRGDLKSALAELATLPPPVRAPAQDWIAKAQAREAALAASRAFAGEALAALVNR